MDKVLARLPGHASEDFSNRLSIESREDGTLLGGSSLLPGLLKAHPAVEVSPLRPRHKVPFVSTDGSGYTPSGRSRDRRPQAFEIRIYTFIRNIYR
jgi:hypothetical protein